MTCAWLLYRKFLIWSGARPMLSYFFGSLVWVVQTPCYNFLFRSTNDRRLGLDSRVI